MSVYCSLTYSHLQYEITCLGNSSKIIKFKLQVIDHTKQNRIVKTFYKNLVQKLDYNHYVNNCMS